MRARLLRAADCQSVAALARGEFLHTPGRGLFGLVAERENGRAIGKRYLGAQDVRDVGGFARRVTWLHVVAAMPLRPCPGPGILVARHVLWLQFVVGIGGAGED